MRPICYNGLPAFEHYCQPKEIGEVASLLTDYGEGAKILAGGTDLLVLMQQRALLPTCLVDMAKIPGLDYIEHDEGDGLRIGALTTLRALELSKIIREEYPLLYEAIHQMATIQVRNMGTVVGNICRASPSADTAPPLLALGAKVKVVGPGGTKGIPLDEFFTGPGKTVLKHNEVVTEIQVPRLARGAGMAFLRVTRVAVDLAKVNSASVLLVKDGVCQDARIALGGVAPTPIRVNQAEEVLRGKNLEDGVIEEAAKTAADEAKPITDIRSTMEYRKELCKVLVKRTLKMSWELANKNAEK